MTYQLVVMECTVGRRLMWAWCLVDGVPGVRTIVFTTPDGLELVDPPEGEHRMGKHLFTVDADPDWARNVL